MADPKKTKTPSEDPGHLSRRDFCAGLGAAPIVGGCSSDEDGGPDAGVLPSGNPPTGLSVRTWGSGKSKVVEVRWAAAVDALGKVHAASVKTMLDTAMVTLIGGSSPWGQWARPDKTVSIKVNSITSQAYTHPEVAGAVARALVKGGAKASKVTVWDKNEFGLKDRGYTVDTTGKGGYRCLGTDSVKGSTPVSAVLPCKKKVTFSPLLTDADLLISVAALKDHSMAGVTLSLKNNFGMIHEAEHLHGNVKAGAACEPGISELAAHKEVKGRLALAAIDALVGVCEGGPGTAKHEHAFRYAGILISQDPVALDRQGLAIIEKRRAKLGLPALSKRTTPNPSPPTHIDNAAKLGVGT